MDTVPAARIIEAGRKTFRSTPADDIYSQNVVIRVTANMLGLEGEDYQDLVRHLVSADEIDADAWRWVTQNDATRVDLGFPRSTVPEGYGGGWTGQTF